MLRIGSHLLVVEAKYASPMSVLGTDGDSVDPNASPNQGDHFQLVREWLSVQPNARGIDWYPSDIRDAIEAPDTSVHIVYLVSTRKEKTALRELSEARAEICRKRRDEPLWLLTWQDLHRVLSDTRVGGSSLSTWMHDLIQLLERRYLDAFLGFPRTLAKFNRQRLEQLHWTATVSEKWAARIKDVDRDYFSTLHQVDFNTISRVGKYWSEVFKF